MQLKTQCYMLAHALFVINFYNLIKQAALLLTSYGTLPPKKGYALILWRDPLTNTWNGPDPAIIWGRGSVCVFDTKEIAGRWFPERLVKQKTKKMSPGSQQTLRFPLEFLSQNTKNKETKKITHSKEDTQGKNSLRWEHWETSITREHRIMDYPRKRL